MQNSDHGRWIRGVVEQYEAALVRYAAQLTGSVHSGRDVVQDTFLRLCQQDRAALDGHLVEWLYTVCRNRALDLWRKEQRMRTMSSSEAALQPSRAVEQSLAAEQSETTDRVLLSLERLTAQQREVVRLKFQHGLSYKEIAAVTQLSASNVGFLLHTAIRKLREDLAEGEER
jgi:RNA polymerase sigma-70 factor (ECF subfamily)